MSSQEEEVEVKDEVTGPIPVNGSVLARPNPPTSGGGLTVSLASGGG